MKNPKQFCLLLLAVLVVSCGRFQKKQAVELSPLPIRVAVVDTLYSGVVRTYVGEVVESSSLALNFAVGGVVEQLLVSEGDQVKKGDLLVSVDKKTAQNAYNVAQATLRQAEDGYNRLKKVHEQGSVADVKWVEMQTQLDKARSLAEIAAKRLNDCDLYAPCDGVVGTVNAKIGANLLPAQPALTLFDVKNVHIAFTVPESEIATIKLDDLGEVEVLALENHHFSGKITSRSLTANPIAHTYKVKIALPNENQQLLPGMVCKIHLPKKGESGFVVDGRIIQTRPEGLSLWCVKNGKAVRTTVESNRFVANGVLITSGLAAGDTIIVEGFQKLYENAPISIEN